ncbi:unnamed protein product, partial [Meganyctiphanes norvegica]
MRWIWIHETILPIYISAETGFIIYETHFLGNVPISHEYIELNEIVKRINVCVGVFVCACECVHVSRKRGIFLKPIATGNCTTPVPELHNAAGLTECCMARTRFFSFPGLHNNVKTLPTRSQLDFLLFDAEIETKKNIQQVIGKVDQKGIKLSGFSELLKIRATEAKTDFPNRHDWDSFFRDAKHMNEMKPGERPDTVHFQELPCRWFAHLNDISSNKPSEYVLRKVMSSFGDVREVDIPVNDPYRRKMSASINGIKTFSFGGDLLFEAYVQFREYIGFAKCMHAFQGKKLVFAEEDNAWTTNIKVDFDRTKHLSEYSIKKREAERDKLRAAEREIEERMKRKIEMEDIKIETERLKLEEEMKKKMEKKLEKKKAKELRRKDREEKRRQKRRQKEEARIKKAEEEEEERLNRKIALEERKLLIAQRKLEGIRLLNELFDRIKILR